MSSAVDSMQAAQWQLLERCFVAAHGCGRESSPLLRELRYPLAQISSTCFRRGAGCAGYTRSTAHAVPTDLFTSIFAVARTRAVRALLSGTELAARSNRSNTCSISPAGMPTPGSETVRHACLCSCRSSTRTSPLGRELVGVREEVEDHVLPQAPFVGEGYPKVWARLRHRHRLTGHAGTITNLL